MLRTSYLLGLGLICGQLVGCGGGEKTSVAGTVKLENQAVERGSIDFLPTGDVGSAEHAVIENGAYRIEKISPGNYTVRISWPRKTGNKIKVDEGAPGALNGEVDEVREAIPAEYNQNSKLQREVKAGTNALDFSLPE